jgi:radical SAM protein with 4Fe4S-binding SPASM domain
LNFAPYFPVSGDPSTLAITGIEYYKALKAAAGVRPLSYCEATLDNSLNNQCHKCAIGDGEFSISATGDVYPCQLLHTDEFYSGNVHDDSITNLYYKSDALNKCANLDVDLIEGCKECPIKYICGGSCRARSFYESGRINSSSDFLQI